MGLTEWGGDVSYSIGCGRFKSGDNLSSSAENRASKKMAETEQAIKKPSDRKGVIGGNYRVY